MVFRQYRRTTQLGRLVFRGLNCASCSRMHPAVLSERHLLQVSLRHASTDRSKVEYTLKMLKEDLMQQDEEARRRLVPATAAAEKKTTLMQKIVHELKHYYHGFRLLALETRLSAKYMWRLLRGDTLSRRERQQLVRTVSDLFRIVPFSIFIIVPFMELALPIFIKLFPNMLPSTFQESSKEEERLRKQVKVKVEMAKFLQDTIEEIALERRSKAIEPKGSKAVEFAQFIKKVRAEGGYVSNQELIKFTKLFEDELTLDNLSMSQLR
ncbi:LETM1-like protein [Ancylostoma caninum]|uniref:LETM1-like protein n=1 Tax=Ancylostoma caninum TaxID=29170 RepID=A0A368FRY3_ANCCA|nr:LETM1-like protein [Ancylostoma caninum]